MPSFWRLNQSDINKIDSPQLLSNFDIIARQTISVLIFCQLDKNKNTFWVLVTFTWSSEQEEAVSSEQTSKVLVQLLQALTEIKALEKQDTNTQGKDIND